MLWGCYAPSRGKGRNMKRDITRDLFGSFKRKIQHINIGKFLFFFDSHFPKPSKENKDTIYYTGSLTKNSPKRGYNKKKVASDSPLSQDFTIYNYISTNLALSCGLALTCTALYFICLSLTWFLLEETLNVLPPCPDFVPFSPPKKFCLKINNPLT